MPQKVTNVFIAGVGGQGILLASEILSTVALSRGLDVKKSEVHGMAQRGGSVTSHVRFGRKVYSPIIKQGEVDILLAFEQLEGLRWLNYMKQEGIIVLNDYRINPSAVNLGQMEYPRHIPEIIRKRFDKFYLVGGTKLALELGNIRAANVVLLGVISNLFKMEESAWINAILAKLPSKLHNINKQAFAMGRSQIQV